jgi:hypothetical protein
MTMWHSDRGRGGATVYCNNCRWSLNPRPMAKKRKKKRRFKTVATAWHDPTRVDSDTRNSDSAHRGCPAPAEPKKNVYDDGRLRAPAGLEPQEGWLVLTRQKTMRRRRRTTRRWAWARRIGPLIYLISFSFSRKEIGPQRKGRRRRDHASPLFSSPVFRPTRHSFR